MVVLPQCVSRLVNMLLVSFSVSSGVAVGPTYMPRYLPFVCEQSMVSQELDVRISLTVVVRSEYGIRSVFL